MKIIKSFRKTVTLRVDDNGEIIVKAPHFTTEKAILGFVEKHKNWIEKRKKETFGNKKEFVEGEKFFYLGREYPLQLDDENKKLFFDGETFWLDRRLSDKVKEKFLEFYKLEAKDYIESRLKYISKKNNLNYNNFKITSAKTRWGSCSSKKNLSFTFRLIMTKIECIDYVIIHELAHLKEMNHSKRFWNEVKIMSENIGLGDYNIRRKWIRENGKSMSYV